MTKPTREQIRERLVHVLRSCGMSMDEEAVLVKLGELESAVVAALAAKPESSVKDEVRKAAERGYRS